ncbi:hypothetical protein ACRAR1_02755 [Streptomyces sanyensis]|uniref:hypothetical protein n=1 Tax=Streptomyces sanyensis TaxID=568869 RepID=UPI003D76E525
MDQDDLAILVDVLPSMKWQAPEGSEQRTRADALMDRVVDAQEAHERAATVDRGATGSC